MGRPKIQPGQLGSISYATRPDGRIRARARLCRLDGKLVFVEALGKSKAEADRRLKARAAEVAHEKDEDADPRTVADVAAKWVTELHGRKKRDELAATTVFEYERIINAVILPQFGARLASELTTPTVYEWHQKRALSAPVAANAERAVLHQVMGLAMTLGMIAANPVRDVQRVKIKRRPVWAPGASDIRALLEAIDDYENDESRPGPKPSPLLRDALTLILATGARIGEVLGLRIEADLHLGETDPWVEVQGAVKSKGGVRWEERPKSEAGVREIFLPPFGVEVVMRRLQEAKAGQVFVFETRGGKPNSPSSETALKQELKNSRLTREPGPLYVMYTFTFSPD